MAQLRYYAVRTAQTIFTLWLVLTFIWLLFRLMPGSFTATMTMGAPPEAIEAFKRRWGLNDPLHVQYRRFIWNYLTLNAGQSMQYSTPVWEMVKMKIFNSFILVAPGVTVAYLLGSLSGTVMGFFRDSKLERYGMVPIIFFGSFPEFILAIFMILIFASWLNVFPTSGMLSAGVTSQFQGQAWWQPYLSTNFLWHYSLPFVTIVLRYLFIPSTIMRASVVETMGQDFTFYHRITGLPTVRQLTHIAKHSSLPVITIYPVSMTRALGGMVLIETVFNWPGIGYTLVQAVLARDFPVLQFVFFIVAAFIVISNFLVDLVYGTIDPRVTVESES